jgi:hypothetical protein
MPDTVVFQSFVYRNIVRCSVFYNLKTPEMLQASWNMMANAQKPDFVFRAKRTSPFKSARWAGRQFSRLLRSRGARISGSNAGYTMFRGSVKSTGYPLHSPDSPSLPLWCVTVCHHISTWLFSTLSVQYVSAPLHKILLVLDQSYEIS